MISVGKGALYLKLDLLVIVAAGIFSFMGFLYSLSDDD